MSSSHRVYAGWDPSSGANGYGRGGNEYSPHAPPSTRRRSRSNERRPPFRDSRRLHGGVSHSPTRSDPGGVGVYSSMPQHVYGPMQVYNPTLQMALSEPIYHDVAGNTPPRSSAAVPSARQPPSTFSGSVYVSPYESAISRKYRQRQRIREKKEKEKREFESSPIVFSDAYEQGSVLTGWSQQELIARKDKADEKTRRDKLKKRNAQRKKKTRILNMPQALLRNNSSQRQQRERKKYVSGANEVSNTRDTQKPVNKQKKHIARYGPPIKLGELPPRSRHDAQPRNWRILPSFSKSSEDLESTQSSHESPDLPEVDNNAPYPVFNATHGAAQSTTQRYQIARVESQQDNNFPLLSTSTRATEATALQEEPPTYGRSVVKWTGRVGSHVRFSGELENTRKPEQFQMRQNYEAPQETLEPGDHVTNQSYNRPSRASHRGYDYQQDPNTPTPDKVQDKPSPTSVASPDPYVDIGLGDSQGSSPQSQSGKPKSILRKSPRRSNNKTAADRRAATTRDTMPVVLEDGPTNAMVNESFATEATTESHAQVGAIRSDVGHDGHLQDEPPWTWTYIDDKPLMSVTPPPEGMGFRDGNGVEVSPIRPPKNWFGVQRIDRFQSPADFDAWEEQHEMVMDSERAYWNDEAGHEVRHEPPDDENEAFFIAIVATVVIQTAVRRYLAVKAFETLLAQRSRSRNMRVRFQETEQYPHDETNDRPRTGGSHGVQSTQAKEVSMVQEKEQGQEPGETKDDSDEFETMALKMFDLAAVKIQSFYRGWWVRDCLQVDQFCAILIQKMVRGFLARARFDYDVYRVVMVQSFFRMLLAQELAVQRLVFVIAIQAAFRGYRTRNLVRDWLNTSFLTEDTAATMIQSRWRAYWAEQKYLHVLADILLVQSVARRWIAQRLVLPYLTSHNIQNSDCIVVDRYNHRRREEEERTKEVLNRSVEEMDATDVLGLWKRREKKNLKSPPKPSYKTSYGYAGRL